MEQVAKSFSTVMESIEYVGDAFSILGVAFMVVGITASAILFVPALFKMKELVHALGVLKIRIGRAMLLGLELLIVADIIETVAREITIENMVALGMLVIIRVLLSWTLSLDIEGHWPWQSKKQG